MWLQSGASLKGNASYLYEMYVESMKGVKHLLVRKSIPNGLVFVGELPYGLNGGFSPKMDHLVRTDSFLSCLTLLNPQCPLDAGQLLFFLC